MKGDDLPPDPRRLPGYHETEDERFLRDGAREEAPPSMAPDAWRVFRIMGEFVEGFERLSGIGPAISVFGSARVPEDHPTYRAARETGRLLGEAGFAVITGGGPGVMEAANRGAHEVGAHSVGCNIELPMEQGGNPYVDVAIDFRYFFVRKTMFVKYARGFVIFPGGYGTMDELFESLTLIQTGKVRNFPIVVFGTSYWEGLMDWLNRVMSAQSMVSPGDLDLIHLTDEPQEVVRHLLEKGALEG